MTETTIVEIPTVAETTNKDWLTKINARLKRRLLSMTSSTSTSDQIREALQSHRDGALLVNATVFYTGASEPSDKPAGTIWHPIEGNIWTIRSLCLRDVPRVATMVDRLEVNALHLIS